MPALFRCERKRLTESQLLAVRNYIKRKKLKVGNSSTNGVANPTENGKQDCPSDSGTTTNIPVAPPGPSAQELREEKENSLRDVTKQLDELERTLDSLKQKKHELFEDIKSLLSSESKKQAEERDRQIHGFPQPFQAVGQGALLNMSPYRPVMGNMKQPKSPSPPLVQLYSPNHPSSTVQSSFDMPLTASPGLVQIHHAAPIHGTIGQGDLPRSPFQQMGNKITGHPDTMLPGYQFQQNFSSRDPRQQAHGSQVNIHPSLSSQGNGTHYTSHERQFMEQRHPNDRPLPSFGNPQGSGNVGHGMGSQNVPRQLMTSQSPFLQQNMLSDQQQLRSNVSDGFSGFSSFAKERPGFNSSGVHRPQGFMRKGSHPPNRSRYY